MAPISIEWVREDLQEYESYFLEELEEIRGYILQAILWLTSRPTQWEHVVTVWLNLQTFPHEEDFFITITYEEDKTVTIALRQISINEDLGADDYTIGYVVMPPFESISKDERENLREDIMKFLKEYKDR